MTIFHLSFRATSTRRGDNGAWQKFERGEIELRDFYVAFGRELSDTVLGNAWYSQHCARKGIGERTVLVPPVVPFPHLPRCSLMLPMIRNGPPVDGFFPSSRPATSQIVQNYQRSWKLTAEM